MATAWEIYKKKREEQKAQETTTATGSQKVSPWQAYKAKREESGILTANTRMDDLYKSVQTRANQVAQTAKSVQSLYQLGNLDDFKQMAKSSRSDIQLLRDYYTKYSTEADSYNRGKLLELDRIEKLLTGAEENMKARDTYETYEDYEQAYRQYVDALRMHGQSRDEYDSQNRGKNREKSTSQFDDMVARGAAMSGKPLPSLWMQQQEEAYQKYGEYLYQKDLMNRRGFYQDEQLQQKYGNYDTYSQNAPEDVQKQIAKAAFESHDTLNEAYASYEDYLRNNPKTTSLNIDQSTWWGKTLAFLEDAGAGIFEGGFEQWATGFNKVLDYAERGANGAAAWALRDLAKAVPAGKVKEKMLGLAEDFESYYTGDSKTGYAEGAEIRQKQLQNTMQSITRGRDGADKWVIEQMPSAGNMLFNVGASTALSSAVGQIPKVGMSRQTGMPQTAVQKTATMAERAAEAANNAAVKAAQAGTSSLAMLGATAGGSAALEAQQNGASDKQAFLYGLSAGAMEVFSEKLFGGNPLYDTDAGLVNQLAAKLGASKTIMKLLDSKVFGIASEGLEEVVTEVIDPVFEAVIYNGESTEFATIEDVANAFAGGVFLSLVGNVVDVPNDVRQRKYKNAAKALAEQAGSIDNADVQRAANAVKDQVETGRTPDAKSVGELLNAMEEAGATDDVIKAAQKVDAKKWGTIKQKRTQDEKIEKGARDDAQKADEGITGNEPWAQEMPQELLQEARDRGYGAAEAATLSSAYKEHAKNEKNPLSPQEYAKRFDAAYLYGKSGTGLQATYGKKEVRGLTKPTIKAAHALGIQAYHAAPYRNTSVSEQTQDAYLADLNDKLASGEISEREYDRAFNDYYQGGESEAAELRSEQPVQNETTRKRTNGQQTATQGAREQEVTRNETGESVLYEGGKRTSGADSRVEDGIVEEGAGRTESRKESARAIREKVDLENQIRDRKIGKVSTRAAGVPGGTQSEIITVVPNDIRTETMREAESFLKAAGFEKVKFVLGAMEIRDGRSGQIIKAEGFADGDSVWVRADSNKYTMMQLAAHESFHLASQMDPNLKVRIANRLMEEYGEEFDVMIAKYIEAYQGCYGLDDPDAWDYIEEILADAFSGMNRKNLGATKYEKAVNEEIKQNKSQRGTRTKRKTGPPLRFSIAETELADSQEAKDNRKTALEFFGKTYKWSETGYLLRNGAKLDFSGRHEGGSGGYRSVDHRDISDAFDGEYGDGSYSGAMVQFMREGNIRISPESGGINLQVMPSKAQESALDDFISRERGEVTMDIDNANGETIASVEYPRGTRASKVLNDIRNYFENGTIPQVSETQRFRYSVEEAKTAWNTEKEQRDIDEFLKGNPDWAKTIGGIQEAADKKAEENGLTNEQLEDLPKKAKDVLRRVRNSFTYKVSSALQVPVSANRNFLRSAVNAMMDEYMKTGKISQETKNVLFEEAYEKGVAIDDEFYNQYKDVKKKIKDTAVTISETDKADIADFALFKKQTSRTLNIKDSGGLPVDVFYQELREMAPELFKGSITHPADQLQKMHEVARSIEVSKRSLDEYYGAEKETFKAWARGDFEQAAAEMESQLAKVRRFAEDQTVKEEPEQEITTVEQANEAYQELKRARREYEKANAKNLLTKADKMIVDKLVRGDLRIEDIAGEQMSREITEVYEAARDYRAAQKRIEQWRNAKRAEKIAQAKRDVGNAYLWKDKKGISYMRETQERNIRDIAPDAETAERVIRNYIRPVHQNNAEATRMKNEYRERVKKLNLSRVIENGNLLSEAAAVQMIGEAEDNIRVLEKDNRFDAKRDGKTLQEWQAVVQKVWQENPNLDKAKIRKAIQDFRTIYDELFQKMNEVRVRNGYEPVNYRKGYFPHFQPGQTDGIISLFAKAMGIDAEVTALPTSITGLTHTFKPGIQWFGPALERIGYNTAYDAVEGFDRYIEGVSDVVWHTDDIQRLRALEKTIRYLSTDDGIREQIDAVEKDARLTMEEKEAQIKQIYEHAKFSLGNFAVNLSEYTNRLANKKHSMDRNVERLIGRNFYNLAKALEGRVAANMVVGNIGSYVTNFIPLTQTWMEVDTRSMLGGMWQTLRSYITHDGFADRSTFLTNRRGSDPLVKTWGQRTSATLSMPMEYIDTFTADSIVRARYLQNVKRGMSEEMALTEADEFAAGVMADRSKGSMPTIFEARNPGIKLFTQFQLEVNNQLSWLFKDVPREMKDRGLKVIAAAIIKYVLGAFIFNDVFEYLFGRRPALDPIGILNDMVGDFTGYELPNLAEGVFEGDWEVEAEKKGAGEALKNAAKNMAEELPFIGGLLGGGRLPISNTLPSATKVWAAVTDPEMNGRKRANVLLSEAAKPLAHWILPFGGGQIKKLAYGIEAVARGGSYTVDKEGNDILQYPVFNETVGQKVGGTVKAVFFGKSAMKGAQEWVESGFKSLSAKQTSAYKAMVAAGAGQMESWDVIDAIRKTKKTEDKSQEANQKQVLAEADISDAAKVACYYALFANEEEQAKIETFVQAGLNMDAYLQYQSATAGLTADKDSKGESIDGTKKRKVLEAINALDVTDEQKDFLVEAAGYKPTVLTPWKCMDYAKFEQAVRTGKGMRDMVKAALKAGAEPGDITEIVTMLFKDEYINATPSERVELKARICTVAEVLYGSSARNQRAKSVDAWLEGD